jgi:hypothetical protein
MALKLYFHSQYSEPRFPILMLRRCAIVHKGSVRNGRHGWGKLENARKFQIDVIILSALYTKGPWVGD